MTLPDAALTLATYLEALPGLDEQQLMEISAVHRGIGAEALGVARSAAADVARAGGLLDELQALHITIAQWVGARYAKSRRYTGEGFNDPPVLIDLREQARPALLDAATALFLVDRLPRDAFDALVGPVDSVIG